MIRQVLVGIVRAYRLLLSPWLGAGCRFEPTCSVYAIEALERHGSLHGSKLAAWRIVRCGPWCQGGHDPVPEPGARALSSVERRPALFTHLLSAAPVSPDASRGTLPLKKP